MNLLLLLLQAPILVLSMYSTDIFNASVMPGSIPVSIDLSPCEHHFLDKPKQRFSSLIRLFRALVDVEDDVRAHRILKLINSWGQHLSLTAPEVPPIYYKF